MRFEESFVLPWIVKFENIVERLIVGECGGEIRERFIAQRRHQGNPFQKVIYVLVVQVFQYLATLAQTGPG